MSNKFRLLPSAQDKAPLQLLVILIFVSAVFLSSHACAQAVEQIQNEEVTEEVPTLQEMEMKDKRAQEGFLLNIRELIKKSKDQINDVNNKIKEQTIRRHNMQREEKAREYYDQAMRLSEEGNYDKARGYWEKAIKITEHPEMKGYIEESVRKTKQQVEALKKEDVRRMKRLELERGYTIEEVEKTYQTAVNLFKQKKFLEAKESFEHVDEMFPDHRATRSYLMVITQEIQKEQQRLIEEKLREEAMDRRKAKEEWRKQLESKEKERQGKLAQQADTLYQEALREYGLRNLKNAQAIFKEVEWIYPDYKSTKRYLLKIEQETDRAEIITSKEKEWKEASDERETEILRQLEDERSIRKRERDEREWINRLEDEVDFLYNAAVTLYQAKKFEDARAKFLEVRQLYPDYKDIVKYLAAIDMDIEKEIKRKEALSKQELEEELLKEKELRLKEEETRLKMLAEEEKAWIQQMEAEAKKLYDVAVELFKKEQFERAREKFQETESLYPNYQTTRLHLSRIDGEISKREKRIKLQEERLRQEQLKAQMQEKKKEQQKELESVEKEEQSRIHKVQAEADVIYNTAITLFNKKLYPQAKSHLDELRQIYPNYKDSETYIKKVEARILQENARLERARQRAFELKVKTEKMEQKREEERLSRLKELDDKHIALRSELEADIFYNSGVSLYEKHLYIHAKEKFLKVREIIPNYRFTDKYLSYIDTAIFKQEKENPQTVVDENVKNVKVLQKNDRPKAKNKQKKEEAVSSSPNVNQTFNADDVVLKAVAQRDKEFNDRVEGKYQKGLYFYKSGDLEAARINFIQTEALEPGYKDVEKYLEEIDQAISNKRKDSKRTVTDKEEKKTKISPPVKKDEIIEKFNREKHDLYMQAVRLYENNQWNSAKERFKELERFSPDYKDARLYIEKIDKQKSLKSSDTNEIKPKVRKKKTVKKNKLFEIKKGKQSNDRESDELSDAEKTDKLNVRSIKNYAELKENEKKEDEDKGQKYQDFLKEKDLKEKAMQELAKEQDRMQFLRDQEIVKLNRNEINLKVNVEKFQKQQGQIEQKTRLKLARLKKLAYEENDDNRRIKLLEEIEKIEKRAAQNIDNYNQRMSEFEQNFADINEQRDKVQTILADEIGNWEKRRDVQVSILKAKENYSRYLDEKKYEEFRKGLEEEERALELMEKERRQGIQIKEKAQEEKLNKSVQSVTDIQSRLNAIKEQEITSRNKLIAQAKDDEEKERERLGLLENQIDEMRNKTLDLTKQLETQRQEFEKWSQVKHKEYEKQITASDEKVQKITRQIDNLQEKDVDSKEDEKLNSIKSSELAQTAKVRKTAKEKLDKYKTEEEKQVQKQKQELKRQTDQIARALEVKEKKEQNRWINDAAEVYQVAINLYKGKKYKEAAAKFAAAERIHPGYRSAVKMADYCKLLSDKEKLRKKRIEEKYNRQEEVIKNKALDNTRIEQVRLEEENRKLATEMLDKTREQNIVNEKAIYSAIQNDERNRIANENAKERLYRRIEQEKFQMEMKAKQESEKRKKEEGLRVKWQKQRQAANYKKEIDAIFKEINLSIRQKNIKAAQEKIALIENKLNNENLSEKHRNKVIRNIEINKEKIKSLLEEEQEEQREKEIVQQKQEEQRNKEAERLKMEKEMELLKIQEKIKQQEDELAKEKLLQEDKTKKALLQIQGKANEADKEIKISTENNKLQSDTDAAFEIKKQKETLRKEHELIQKEYRENLDKLYNEAVSLFRSGLYRDAKIIFNEVSSIEPDFKLTDNFMEKIQTKLIEEETKQNTEKNKQNTVKELNKSQPPANTKPAVTTRLQLIQEALNSVETDN